MRLANPVKQKLCIGHEAFAALTDVGGVAAF
jgi:hypothetical protein